LKVKKKSGQIYEIPVVMAEVQAVPGENTPDQKGSKSKIFSLNKYEWDEAISIGHGLATRKKIRIGEQPNIKGSEI
jgi:hypothetical protein